MGYNQYHFGRAKGGSREEAIQLHRLRYLELGFFMDGEKDPYEEDSLYFMAKEKTSNRVVGVTRLIFKPIEELPTIKNFDIYDIDLVRIHKWEKHRYAEMSAFTKLPRHEVGLHLIRTTLRYSYENGTTHWVACIDERVYRYLNRVFSSIFKRIGVPKLYLGSVSVPCIVDIPFAMEQIKVQRPRLFQFLNQANDQILEVSNND